jgi:hypothetical protein
MLSRRRFLIGGGALIGLPLLPSLVPRELRAQSEEPIKRFVALYFPNGSTMFEDWQLSGTETSWTMGTAHTALAPHQSKLSMFKALNGQSGGAPDHSRGTAEFLTGAMISDQNTPTVDISIDQAIADSVDPPTRLRSLHLGPDPSPSGPPADTGWPSGYNVYLSWSSPSAPNAPLEDPQVAFDQVFVPSGDSAAAGEAERRLRLRQSILDHAIGQVDDIMPRLGTDDAAKLDEYLTVVRDVESRLQVSVGPASGMTSGCEGATAPGSGLDHVEHTRAMIDIAVLALQCDATRILTYSMDYGFGNKNFDFLGLGNFAHHNLSHGGTAIERVDAHKGIVDWYMQQFAHFLDRMDSIDEGAATLLDNSLVYHGSDVGDAWSHSHQNLCITVAGGAAGAINPGRLLDGAGVAYPRVLLALAHAMDANLSSFAGETSPYAGL